MAFNASTVTADCFAVTPSTNAAIKFTAYGFVVGAAGNVNVVTLRGNTVLFTACQAGVPIPQGISAVRATNTTATGIVAFGPQ